MAIVFPTAAQAALQTPIYTFSTTSTPLANTVNNNTYVYDVARGAWTASGSGGGGGVSTVTAAAPLASSGGSTPNITATLATTAQAAAGTSNVVLMTPQLTVPKDATGMTGAAILPSGTDAQRAAIASPTGGMLRFNTTSGFFEGYQSTGSSWKELDYVYRPSPAPTPLNIAANTTLSDGYYVCSDLTIAAGVTVTVGSQNLVIECFGNATILGNIVADGVGPSGASVFNTPNSYSSKSGLGQGGAPGEQPANSYTAAASLTGSGGGIGNSGLSSAGGISSGSGGSGGGGIAIKALGTIVCSGTLSARGSNATAPAPLFGATSYWVSGNGGGSGGIIILQAEKTINFSGTIDVRGGNGSNAIRATVTDGPCGGGGGGGGLIILQASGGLTNTGTTTLTGGTAGTPIGINNLGGGGGGSCGGKGGAGSSINGSVGRLLTSGSPL